MQVRKDHRKCQEMLRMRQEEAATVVLLLFSAYVYTLTYADVCRCGRYADVYVYVCRMYTSDVC